MLIALMAILTALLFWQFFGYPLLMAVIYKRRHPVEKDYSYQPFISVIIPVYNEAAVIRGRIENLLMQDYPSKRFEIIIVDSGSTDNTAEITRELEKNFPVVKVIREEKRQGKAAAINLGKLQAKGEIILVTDANTIFREDALSEIAPHFKDPMVGAVGGRFVLSNANSELLRASSFYWEIESLVRRGESEMDSTCLFHGEINAWRKGDVTADTDSLAEDLDMAIWIRRRGLKIVYEPYAIASEPGPATRKEQIIQKKRATIGTIQSFFKHRRYLWLPSDRYSGIIFPSHKTLQIFSPFLLVGLLAVLAALIVSGKFIEVASGIMAMGILFTLLFVLLRRELTGIGTEVDSGPGKTDPASIIGIFSYVLLHEYIILLAWRDYITGNYSVIWQKVESTRRPG